MSFASQFLGGGQPVGSIVPAPYNITDAAWLPCQGQRILRATYPQMSACQPTVGVFTATQRTKPGTSSGSAMCVQGANFVLAGPTGASAIITTPDGVTYTPRTTPAGTTVTSLVSDGTNVVAAAAGANPLYSTDAGLTWLVSATPVVTGSYGQQTIAYAPSLGANGRFLLLDQGTFTVWTSDNRGVTWTARPNGLSASLTGACWTGNRYIGPTSVANSLAVSSDGITWSAMLMPFSLGVNSTIVSDGAGKVLILDTSTNMAASSQDHGSTWAKRLFGGSTSGGVIGFTGVPSFANGRFFVTPAQPNAGFGFLCSTDLQAWVLASDVLLSGATGQPTTFAFKAGVYLTNGLSQTVYSFTEDTTRMYLPGPAQNEAGFGSASSNNFQPFIKVQ